MTCRILMLLGNNGYPDDIRVLQESLALNDAGYNVTVLAPRDPGEPWAEDVDGVQAYRYPPPPPANGFMGYVWEYTHTLIATFILSVFVGLRHGFDVIHLHNPPDTFVCIAAFYKLFGKRFIFDHHDLSPEMYNARFNGQGSPLVYRALLTLESICFRLADHVISTNQSYKSIAIERGGVRPERISVVRNGPDLHILRPVTSEPTLEVLRQQGKTILAYAGVMGVQDGVDCLIRAMRHLVYDLGRQDAYAVLLGRGDAFEDLQQLVTESKLDDYIWFTDWIPYAEVGRYLGTADICVAPEPSNPYTDYSTTIKMMEYMTLGKPIVAFALPEHHHTAQDAAVYVPCNDEFQFAQAIANLMDNPTLRLQMGQKGLERIETELAWPYQAKHLLEAYDTLTMGKL